MAEDQKGGLFLVVTMIFIFVVIIGVAIYFLLIANFNVIWPWQHPVSRTNSNQQQNTQTQTDPTASWNIFKNDQLGFQFKYPTGFDSKYAFFQGIPTAVVTTDALKINTSGCMVAPGNGAQESQVTINGLAFCLSTAFDPGAGQLYNGYYYTTLKNGNYITLQYVVHTLNGCSQYMGTPDYQPCTDFMNNYANNVTQVIQNSVSTLQFTK